jgi:2-succinyl-6-hydroxy-2,4-cyclohexadiene-1-carboxylate synthase
MARLNMFFLHGFMGRPADWEPVRAELIRHEKYLIKVPDYFKIDSLSSSQSFSRWAHNFNKWVEQEVGGIGQNVLVGYSLGGRLALHALEQNSNLWAKVVLMSVNPGFTDGHEGFTPDSEERGKRWLNDSYWAQQFLTGSWENVVQNWNSQPVFAGGGVEPVRIEKDYSRDHLSLALTQWSLAEQKDLRPVIKENAKKILWLAGEKDEKFADLTAQLKKEIPHLDVSLVPEASHRVLFDQPAKIATKIRSFLHKFS